MPPSSVWFKKVVVMNFSEMLVPVYICSQEQFLKLEVISDPVKGKGKAIPLQALKGPEGSRRLRHPDFKTIGTGRWKGCQSYAPATFTPRKYSWYSFPLEAESTSVTL
jgi:hypothetical protein